jgi:NAD(P)-dependent dehydrogenase (short-subunit alcohol dehydrogenase family)
VDVLVDRAGNAMIRCIGDLTEDECGTAIAVNLKSAFRCTKPVFPHMRAQKGARFGTSEDVAQAVLMAIGNGYTTGQTIQRNGGMRFL